MIAMATVTDSTLRLGGTYNGPPGTANGGFACGAVARFVDGPAAQVRLQRPPALDADLPVHVDADGTVTVREPGGGEVVATGRPVPALDDVVPPVRPSLADARAAMREHWGIGKRTMLSDCWVCSPYRHDGLGMCFGPLAGHDEVNAAAVLTDPTLPSTDGLLDPEVLWGALDCPSYLPRLSDPANVALLAQMTGELLEPVPVGTPLVVVGWHRSSEGRKSHTASALLDPDGRVLGRALALWIEIKGGADRPTAA